MTRAIPPNHRNGFPKISPVEGLEEEPEDVLLLEELDELEELEELEDELLLEELEEELLLDELSWEELPE